ncbi:hypothetical protein [Halalkalibacter lacteus]|uniref:hypothetical protein n=1 Tax=Halalkalibacter lacteus TaxID=3090663 RepID=UPI002FCC06C6
MDLNKINHLQAFALIYDIETHLKHLIEERLSPRYQANMQSYGSLINIAEMHNLLYTSKEKYVLLQKTINIRNKICHMRPLKTNEFAVLRQVHHNVKKPSYEQDYRVVEGC